MEFVCVFVVTVFVLINCAVGVQLAEGWTVDDDRCRTPDSGTGFCINIQSCNVIYKFVDQNTITDEIAQELAKYKCGDSKVCCPNKLPDSLVDHTRHPNRKLLPQNCGRGATGDKIIGGNVTELFEFPWAVALKLDAADYPWSCGGALINDRYVLTAAHCIKSKYKLAAVRLGEHDFSTDPDCNDLGTEKECAASPQDFQVSDDDAIVHPDYQPLTQHNDIALIRLSKPAILSDSVSPVCLPLTTREKINAIRDFTVIGWGRTERRFTSNVLLKVLVPKVENSICAQSYGERKLTEKQLCAGGRNEQDSCEGDSGGPLLGEYALEGVFKTIQYGIVSLGPNRCAIDNFPTLYTRVDKYIGWILDNIKR